MSYEIFHADCFDWLRDRPGNSIHGVLTDPFRLVRRLYTRFRGGDRSKGAEQKSAEVTRFPHADYQAPT